MSRETDLPLFFTMPSRQCQSSLLLIFSKEKRIFPETKRNFQDVQSSRIPKAWQVRHTAR
jgi:hypothetical protein